MFEKLVAWVLNTYIGEYVEDLNTDNLYVGITNGQVELGYLPLKKDALRHLDMPIQVKSGFIGRVSLVIPWKQLNSAPWVITLEDVFLVAGPLKHSKYDESAENKANLARKKAQLQALEDKWQVEKQLQANQSNQSSGGWGLWGYGASLASMGYNIVENLQLEVKNVHIRYEDDISIPGHCFACGVTIDTLSAQSTDASWIPKFVSRSNADIMRKLADLKALSLYWDVNTQMVSHLNGKELQAALDKIEHTYILEPVTAGAKMTRNLSALPLRSRDQPRLLFDIQMEKMAFAVSETQFHGMTAWMQEYHRFDKARLFRKWRPQVSIKENVKAWWKFAIEANLNMIHERNKRLSKEFIVQRAEDIVLYSNAYKEKVLKGEYYMDWRLKEDLERIEADWSFEELKIIRENTMTRLADEEKDAHIVKKASPASTPVDTTLEESPQRKGYLQSIFPGWGGWYGGGVSPTSSGPQLTVTPSNQSADSTGRPPTLHSAALEASSVPIDHESLPSGQEQVEISDPNTVEKEIEEEIFNAFQDSAENSTLLKRDTVFAQINFCLQSGIFKLLEEVKGKDGTLHSLLEVEASTIKMCFETRPRTQGLKYGVSVGGLFLRDKMTEGSILPVLVAPQQRDKNLPARGNFFGMKGTGSSKNLLTPSALFGNQSNQQQNEQNTLFELNFEQNPYQSSADYRLEIKTKPLDIVYNPAPIKRVKEFFTIRDPVDFPKSDIELAVAAKARYEELKKQTQAELKQTLDNFLEGEETIKAKRWDIHLDISAPQIIIPKKFTDENTTLVVLDLGHLEFYNLAAGLQEEQRKHKDSAEDEDDFVTPSSTPPNEEEAPPPQSKQTSFNEIFSNLTDAALQDKIYDKYTVKLSDLQVMVGQAQDKWKYARSKGTSPLHAIDKFSISLQLEKRLLYTSDPKWPKMTVAGTLPSLVLHFSEHKIAALQSVMDQLSASQADTKTPVILSTVKEDKLPADSMYYSVYQAYSKSVLNIPDDTENEEQQQALAESKSILMQFSINHLSVDVQSRAHSIAELQVSGVRANFTKRPFDTSMSLTVHSLLVVDALQTFGKDFELLVASHKNLCLDSRSGSIHESDPSSPVSPMSPMSPRSPAEPSNFNQQAGLKNSFAAMQTYVSNTLQNLVTTSSVNPVSDAGSSSTPSFATAQSHLSPNSSFNKSSSSQHLTPPLRPDFLPFLPIGLDSEALIKIELDILSPQAPGGKDETLHIANVQFNNLDFVANQHTIVELLGFFKRVLPSGSSVGKEENIKSPSTSDDTHANDSEAKAMPHWELNADFNRLNVLLMRVEEGRDRQIARKVATATMSEAKFQASLSSEGTVELEGSLGGLQLLDLTSTDRKHQTVVSVGLEPPSTYNSHLMNEYARPIDMYKTAHESMIMDFPDKAFTFNFVKPGSYSEMDRIIGGDSPPCTPIISESKIYKCKDMEMHLKLRMASLLYTHSPLFLKDLSGCLTEFKDYVTKVGDSIKSAATEMAMGLVHKESVGQYGSNISLERESPVQRSFRAKSNPLKNTSHVLGDGQYDKHQKLILDAKLKTPVIFFPRAPRSSEVLVAQLGQIAITNSSQTAYIGSPMSSTQYDSMDKTFNFEESSRERVLVEIRDMTMYSTDLEKSNKPIRSNLTEQMSTSMFTTPQPGGQTKTSYGTPILLDTVLEFTVEQLPGTVIEPVFVNQENNELQFNMSPLNSMNNSASEKMPLTMTPNVLQITGKIVTPLKVVLSKHVYEQILNTLDNIAPPDDEEKLANSMNHTWFTENMEKTASPESPPNDVSSIFQHGASSLSSSNVPSPDMESKSSNSDLILKANFEIPLLNITATGDLGDAEGEKSLVDIKLEEFTVLFEKSDAYTKDVDVRLKSLIMEDMLAPENSKYRHLMASCGPGDSSFNKTTKSEFLSSSCPTSMIDVPNPDMPSSLPSILHREHVFMFQQPKTSQPRTRRSQSNKETMYPCTPPPSPSYPSRKHSVKKDDMLVHIKVKLVDKKCPEFASKYNSTNRFVDVDFNSLDATINLQTWVVLLDFLGMGAKVHDPDQFTRDAQMFRTTSTKQPEPPSPDTKEPVNTEVNLSIESFAVIFNKPQYEFSRASITGFNSHVSLRDGNFHIKGELGKMSLSDQSPHGFMFRERFTTTGEQALDFDVLKYGTPDPDMLRPCDVEVKLRMSSICYVHTNHFIQEMLAFLQHFNQLQDVLGRMRAAHAGQKIALTAQRGARINLDIEAGAPILLVPHSSKTTDVLVINMGNLTVNNKFLLSGSKGTIQYKQNQENDELKAKREREYSESEAARSRSSSNSMPVTDLDETTQSPERPSSLYESTMMNQSIYGSLDGDLRSESLASPLETTVSNLLRNQQCDSNKPALSSFYQAVGGSVPSSVSSSIGPKEQNLPDPMEGISEVVTPESPVHQCIVDVMSINLLDMEVYSAEWVQNTVEVNPGDLCFSSYIIQRQPGRLLKEKAKLMLQVERNLEGDISHSIPDFQVTGLLTSVHFSLDLNQFKLVKGLLAHNFGEPLEEFEKPLMSHLQDPKIQTVLSGEVWKTISISLDLENVVTELLIAHDGGPECPQASLAKWDFMKSTLIFESYSNGSKDIDLVSHELRAHDTRYDGMPANTRPSVFNKILQPSSSCSPRDSLQMELHYRSTKEFQRFTVLLNNMRLMGVFDWLLAVKDFLLTGADDPWKKEGEKPIVSKKVPVSPMVKSTGILTKRNPAIEEVSVPFELKLNVTDTELVVVENTSMFDTHAVILKSTAALSWQPSLKERPMTCNLLSLEVFSCSLAAEDETALSIIDPMIVTLELNGSSLSQQKALGAGGGGLLDATSEEDKPPVLEVTFSTLNIRLSYNDMKLFKSILNAMPKQLVNAQEQSHPKNKPRAIFPAKLVRQLEGLGFSKTDCEMALETCEGRLDDSAVWLTQNAMPKSIKAASDNAANKSFISGFELKAGNICLCVIDDCLDADVPLAEFTFSSINLIHKMSSPVSGRAGFRATIDYYNRSLSGWEPMMEQWGANLYWQKNDESSKLSVDVSASDLLKINITSTLLEQYKKTKTKWADDLSRQGQHERQNTGLGVIVSSRRRVPFIPFAIRNQTGCKLKFATVATTPTRINISHSGVDGHQSQHEFSEWRQVNPGDELPFLIEERGKIRHKNTHELRVHQLAVRVEGWKEVTPVSVDKVGVYFRQAQPQDTAASIMSEAPTARIVFDVSIEGSARKVITVRSALMMHNQLDDKVEVQLLNTLPYADAKNRSIFVAPHEKQAIPLPHVHSQMRIRPINWSLDYCNKPVSWTNVTKIGPQGEQSNLRVCDTVGGDENTYKFCVSVMRLPFPPDMDPNKKCSSKPQFQQPGHMITLLPPVRIVNLLPIDLMYHLKGETDLRGTIKPGKMAPLIAADLRHALELGITLENFPQCKELVIPPGTLDYKVKLRLYDSQDRLLELYVRIKAGLGGSLKLSISAPYWLMNKSGLPIIFKQDGASQAAAGQFEEHELARSVVPLLFSYADKESAHLCCMKLGRSVHGVGTRPQWCPRFSLERGIGVRQLHVIGNSNRPDWVYNIGIEVRQGRGRYRDTNIVTFSPRYQLDNRSSHKLAFAQKYMADKTQNVNASDILTALPNCTLSYHWPRVDLDPLLCVRMMDVASDWSGGFRIDLVDSFHINMRNASNECLFLRLDIVLQGATFFIVFTDADHMPPPYRIDNFAEVPITYFQTKVLNEKLRTQIKPRTSAPYTWDEPTLEPHITLAVPGGSSATYNMDVVGGDGDQLYYENFIYIAFQATFKSASPMASGTSNFNTFVESQNLVLEAIPGSYKIILKKKEAGNRFQLWRMTSTGMLKHEGSSVPRDPKKISVQSPSHVASSQCYVLDIADIALQPGRDVALCLRKPDTRRQSTQTWKFLEDGRLCCGNSTAMCVQARDGMFGLREGAEAILGSTPSVLVKIQDLPVEMKIERQKMRPGSGMLSVKVITDGPTRVLQITDIKQQRYMSYTGGEKVDWVMVEEAEERPELLGASDSVQHSSSDVDVKINLYAGIGISFVNKVPEELIFIVLAGIDLDYSTSSQGQALEMVVKGLQIDNQLLGTSRPILMYATPSKSDAGNREMPALQVSAHKIPNHKWNAEIFKHFIVIMKRMTLQIEETLLWKVVQFLKIDTDLETIEESGFDSQRAVTAATESHFKRYYFGALKLSLNRINLSMESASDLPPDLAAIKKAMGIPLIRFEDAKVELDPFAKIHVFETAPFLLENIKIHYTEELKSQSAKILGSVDFLGNPLGLFNDVAEGVSGLLKDGNVGGLVKNLAHGISNSTAKMSGTAGDMLAYTTFDESHQKLRQTIKSEAGGSGSHLLAGMKGLGYGLMGGLTSIVTQTYTGVKHDGFEGLITGVGKGLVGTVTKPVTGVFDFAAGTSNAIRYTSKGRSHKLPPKCRPTRCCYGPGGLLPCFSAHHAEAQDLLYSLNNKNFAEMFIALEQLRFTKDDNMKALISSEEVFLLGGDNQNLKIVMQVSYEKLFECRSIPYDNKYFIELTVKADTERGVSTDDPKKRPLVRCDSEAISQKVAQQISYAKGLFEERNHTLPEMKVEEPE